MTAGAISENSASALESTELGEEGLERDEADAIPSDYPRRVLSTGLLCMARLPDSSPLEAAAKDWLRDLITDSMCDPRVQRYLRDLVREELAGAGPSPGTPGASVTSKHTLTVAEAAQYASVTEGTIRDWISRGRLEALKAGSRYRIREEDLLRCMANHDKGEHVSLDAEASKIVALDRRKARGKEH